MRVTRRVSAPIGALVAGAAALTPLAFNSPAQAAPTHLVNSRTAQAPDTSAGEASALAGKEKGIHSRSGVKKCGKGETVWLGVKAIGKTRVSWRPTGGKLVSRKWPHDISGLSMRTIPTWHKKAKWKVTSIYGVGKKPKRMTKAYAYCSKNGWPVGPGQGKVNAKKSGIKRCPAGKTVMIEDTGIGYLEHKFKSLKPGSKVRMHRFSNSQGVLITTRLTPTEMRSVKWVINARKIKNVEGKIATRSNKGYKLSCISKY